MFSLIGSYCQVLKGYTQHWRWFVKSVNNTVLTLAYSKIYKLFVFFYIIVNCIFSLWDYTFHTVTHFQADRQLLERSHKHIKYQGKIGILKKFLNYKLIWDNISSSICSENCPTLLQSLQLTIRKCDFLTECAQGRPHKRYTWQGDVSKRFGSQLQAFKTISGTWHTSLFKLRCFRNVRGLSLPSFSFVWAHLKFPALISSLFRLPVMGNWELRTNVWKILAIKKKSSEWPQSLPSP